MDVWLSGYLIVLRIYDKTFRMLIMAQPVTLNLKLETRL